MVCTSQAFTHSMNPTNEKLNSNDRDGEGRYHNLTRYVSTWFSFMAFENAVNVFRLCILILCAEWNQY